MIREVVAVRAVSEQPLKTQWRPVDLACSHSEQELIVRTKLVRSPDSAAVCIAEAVSHAVVKCMSLQVPECHAVLVGDAFAQELTRQYSFEPGVFAGRHWGTTFLENKVQEIEFDQSHVEYLERPTDMFRLFLADVVLANPDRLTYGNLLLGTPGDSGKCALIPIDHSDCFNHPTCLRDSTCLTAAESSSIAGWLPGTEAVLLRQNRGFARSEMDRVSALESAICDSATAPPDEWYDRAGVDPAGVEAFLRARVRNLPQLARLDYWENLHDVVDGGQLLDL